MGILISIMGISIASLMFPQHGQSVQLIQAKDSTAATCLVSVIQIITKLHSTQIQHGMSFYLLLGHSYNF